MHSLAAAYGVSRPAPPKLRDEIASREIPLAPWIPATARGLATFSRCPRDLGSGEPVPAGSGAPCTTCSRRRHGPGS